jgi:hypothetical protein
MSGDKNTHDALPRDLLLSAGDLTILVESQLRDMVKRPDSPTVPWHCSLSDHMPRTHHAGKIAVTTWNILNGKYLRYLKPRKSSKCMPEQDAGQRLGLYDFAKEELTGPRELLIVGEIVKMVNSGSVVCLQEVSKNVFALLSAMHYAFSCCNVSEDGSNRNMTLWSPSAYTQIRADSFFAPSCRTRTGRIGYVTLAELTTGETFNLINLHVPFGTNNEHAKLLLRMFGTGKNGMTFIAGDTNASSRRRHANASSDSIAESYADPRFRFSAAPPLYSHVNTFENTLDTRLMPDVFDHIILIGELAPK